jgi:6-phosphogluconolactonase
MVESAIIPGADDAAIAEWLRGRLARALARTSGPVAIAVPGGSTPFPILARLAALPLEWPRIEVWPGDDRLVPESHEASNVGRIRALLEPAGANITALTETARPPHFVLVWLGMGDDGHVASLFPAGDPRADDPLRVRRLTPDPLPPAAPFERVSLTIPALLDTDELVFVIRGAGKRALFEQALRGANDLPVARLLRAAAVPVTCFS